MKIKDLFKNLIHKIKEIDIKTKHMSEDTAYTSNPFSFKTKKTYVWVEKKEKPDFCDN